MTALWCSVIMAALFFIMPETRQFIILIIYTPYFLKDLVEV